ncbi:uncharacterized protein LOC127796506 [Diospyros lotus]|uniref:uncharacterized protein LOC127796506 n=1 Tax=Diospyros lotus TaxID=55363 RepID=UPI00225878C3|nr:uncharacterized protein LOC127796506 [Diospyros lotus]
MPSVGMKRTTRIFGARVLRSGKRLCSEPGERKRMRAAAPPAACAEDGSEWIELLDNSGSGGGDDNETLSKENGWQRDGASKPNATVMDTDKKVAEPKSGRNKVGTCRNVYSRKRKRIDAKNSELDCGSEDRKYGIHFSRKQRRNKKIGEVGGSLCYARSRVLYAVIDSYSCAGDSWIACVLSLILSYLSRINMGLLQLSAFLFPEPLSHVFSSQGIRFLWDSPPTRRSGICTIYGTRGSAPLFSVDFLAVPSSFIYLHSTLLLQSACLSNVLAISSDMKDNKMNDAMEHISCIHSDRDSPGTKIITSGNNSGKRKFLYSALFAPKVGCKVAQFGNGANSGAILKKNSVRPGRRRVKNPTVLWGNKGIATLVAKYFSSRQDGILLPSVASDGEYLSSVQKSSIQNIKELKSSGVELAQDIGSKCCFANILVIESDTCYRVKGGTVKLEVSSSKQWFLAIMKDGITRFKFAAKKFMRPCSSNRMTHDIIWTEDNNNWKLEFPDRQDWLIFKELYRECFDRNVQAATAEFIPVPGVYEVSSYADSYRVPFKRPDSYISVKDDELSRALAKTTSNYDMDSEDEEWLRKYNSEFPAKNGQCGHVSEESFELMIDTFEKAIYHCPDDLSNEKAAVNVCSNLERKEVVEAVYSYWIKKRKQKHSALVRVFQCYSLARAQPLSKPVRQKKRSFKRQAGPSRRYKQPTFTPARAPEEVALEDENALVKVQEAKTRVSRSEALAVVKRQRAQVLMDKADLATYKAAMALRFAESAGAAASFFLDLEL